MQMRTWARNFSYVKPQKFEGLFVSATLITLHLQIKKKKDNDAMYTLIIATYFSQVTVWNPMVF